MLEKGSLVDGKYRILRVLGKGCASVVYQAVDEKANRIWAIKELRNDGFVRRVHFEVSELKKISHPGIPKIIDIIEGDGYCLMVMEFIEGEPLSRILETSGAQTQEDVIQWSKELCEILIYLHSRTLPIYYREMKPANIMLKPDGHVSLIEFGTVRVRESGTESDDCCFDGVRGYAAPEQYCGRQTPDARTDIYRLGATMHHLVTGHSPCMPPYEMLPIRQCNPALSSRLERIILKCTQLDRNDRYQSCAELLCDLGGDGPCPVCERRMKGPFGKRLFCGAHYKNKIRRILCLK